MRFLRNLAVAVLLVYAGLSIAKYVLPERFAVNAPISDMLFGWDRGNAAAGSLLVPRGFSIGLYAADIHYARMLRFTPKGDLLVSTPRTGEIKILVADHNGDGAADAIRTVIGDLNNPHGIDLFEGQLYIAEEDAVGRVAFNSDTGLITGGYQRIVSNLPTGGGHSTRTVRVGPDRKLYVTVGSSCNACIEEDERRAAMLRFDLDGGNGEVFARGLRNSVGFDWRPQDGAIYATDNGRDLLGENTPPCELNRIEQGRHYGWPYFYGDNQPDPDVPAPFAMLTVPPVHGFRAHNAPLGISFVRNKNAPPSLRGAALVALHGSWNRTVRDGYKVVSLHWLDNDRIEERDFLWGFEHNNELTGRPVDVAEGPDGAFYVSSDYAGAVYRVVWDKEN